MAKTVKADERELVMPWDELAMILREATLSVEKDLRLEDEGWINLTAALGDIIPGQERILNLRKSRLYYLKDPLGRQAVRLWTDYTFGSGMTWQIEDDKAKEVLKSFWDAKANQNVLSARGQRKSSDKLLVDGEVFFAIFLGPNGVAKIRWIDPLEITEIITNPEDIEDVRFYKREWTDAQGKPHTAIYPSSTNKKGESALDASGAKVEPSQDTKDTLVYHLTYNTITQRGNPLLLPALIWMKYHTKFLASRIAIMLALAKFAWKGKIKGGPAAVEAAKARIHDKEIEAASTLYENLGSDTTPIKTDTGARNAYQDGRMIKLMICAAVGIPEQYFGDISIGNLATAKTVELPMMKMFQSYQKVWNDTYQDIDEIILEHNKVPSTKWYIDRDFPAIAPADVAQIAKSLVDIIGVLPEFAESDDVKQIALMALGVNDPAEVIEALAKEVRENPDAALAKALRKFRESLNKKEIKG